MLRRCTIMGSFNPSIHRNPILDKCGNSAPNMFLSNSINVSPPSFRLTIRITTHQHTLSSLTGILVLPIVPVIDIAAVGAVVCSVIPSTSPSLYRTMLASYAFWGIGFPLANIILIIYFLRLTIHNVLPTRIH
jgi:Voltage-dependent anion channel